VRLVAGALLLITDLTSDRWFPPIAQSNSHVAIGRLSDKARSIRSLFS